MKPEFETILEMVGPQGEFIDTLAGRVINPGHCMETGWFILDIAKSRGWDPALVKMGTTIIDWAWKWGWDEEYGGMINFRDCKNFPPQDYSQDMKFWWPQCETILAGLYAYQATGKERCSRTSSTANGTATSTGTVPSPNRRRATCSRDPSTSPA